MSARSKLHSLFCIWKPFGPCAKQFRFDCNKHIDITIHDERTQILATASTLTARSVDEADIGEGGWTRRRPYISAWRMVELKRLADGVISSSCRWRFKSHADLDCVDAHAADKICKWSIQFIFADSPIFTSMSISNFAPSIQAAQIPIQQKTNYNMIPTSSGHEAIIHVTRQTQSKTPYTDHTCSPIHIITMPMNSIMHIQPLLCVVYNLCIYIVRYFLDQCQRNFLDHFCL